MHNQFNYKLGGGTGTATVLKAPSEHTPNCVYHEDRSAHNPLYHVTKQPLVGHTTIVSDDRLAQPTNTVRFFRSPSGDYFSVTSFNEKPAQNPEIEYAAEQIIVEGNAIYATSDDTTNNQALTDAFKELRSQQRWLYHLISQTNQEENQ